MRATALKKATRTGRVRHLRGANYVLGRKTASPQGPWWALEALGGRMAPPFSHWSVAKFSRGANGRAHLGFCDPAGRPEEPHRLAGRQTRTANVVS
jgi:hypothetical protein